MARVVVPGVPHHVVQRGRGGRKIFFSTADRRRFLELLKYYSRRRGLKVRAYALMPDRVSMVVTPKARGSLGAALKLAIRCYAKHLRRKGRRGRIWKGRFGSCPIDPRYYREAARHVERGPVRAGLVTRAEEYRWSSAAAHCGKREDPLVSGGAVKKWAAWLGEEGDPKFAKALERHTRTGRPLGSKEFIVALERRFRRHFRCRKPGRPPKKRR